MASPYDPNDPSRALGQLERELAKMRARMDTLLANDRKRQEAPASKPASRTADERTVGRKSLTKDSEAKTGAMGVTEARTSQKTATDQLAQSEARLARAQALSGTSLRTNIQQGYGASQELRRRGALTTEAIAAAARGTLTFRELGFQVGATIGKFAGWTLAAGFTFAAIDAVQQLGQGALQGAEGVNKLTRVINNVDTSKAHDQIRSLAEAANQDLGTVGEGLFESGKVFNNQDDAEKLTRVALRAKNIGELEVGDAVRFLTSVVRGFKLEAGDATDVLDIFNNLQQKFGTDIRGGLQGGAQAAAQVLNAGGNLRQMSALIATIQRAGFSGSEAGVAIRRSTELVHRPGSINKERLAKFGIDADLPYRKIVEQAVQLAESGKLKGPQINELATALVTPQLSPRFAAVLNRPDQFRRAERIVSPASAKDSASKEEAKFLHSPIQQLKAIGVELGKLGDALGEAGAFKTILLMGKALENSLEAATQLVNVFNELPKPLRTALIVAGQLYAVTRLIRRFNQGDGGITPGRFATKGHPSGFFQPSPDTRLRKFLRSDARNEVQYFRDTQEGAARRQTDTAFRRQIAVQENQKVRSADYTKAQAGDKAALGRVLASDRAAVAASEAAAAAKVEYVAANKALTAAIANQAKVDKLTSRGSVYTPQGAARMAGFQTVSTTQDVPTHIQPGYISPGGVQVPSYTGQKPLVVPTPNAEKQFAKNATKEALRKAATQGTLVQRYLGVLGVGYNRLGTTVKGLPSAANRVGNAGARAAAGLGIAASSIGAMLGPIEFAILGIIGLTEALSSVRETSELAGRIEKNKGKLSVAQAQAQLQEAKQTGGGLGGLLASLPGRAKQRLFGAPGSAYESAQDSNVANSEFEVQEANKRDDRRRARERRLAAVRAQYRSTRVHEGYNPRVFDDDQLQGEIDALSTLADLGRLGKRGITDLTQAYIEALNRFAGSRNPDEIKKLAAAQQGFQTALGAIEQNFEQQLDLAGDDRGAQRGAYHSARAQALVIRQQARRNLAETRRRLQHVRDDARKEQQAQIEERRQQNTFLGSDLGQLPAPRLETKIKEKRNKAKKAVTAAERALKQIQQFLRELFNSLAKAFDDAEGDRFSKFDEQTDLIRQRAEVASSGTLNTGSQLAARLNAANQNLSRARSLGNGPEAERRINDAIIERNGIMNEFANLAVQQLEATNAIAVANAPTEQARIKAELSGAQQKLSLLQSQGRGPEETNVVVAEIIRLKKELNRQILEDANNLAEASAEYAKSLTGSDIREANIDVRLADTLLRNARKIEDPTERRIEVLRAKAKRNEARGSRTLTGFSDRYETIEYKARIGLISSGQELNLIQALLNSVTKKQLRTIDGMREFFRSLKERMKQLNDESNVEINPGSIKLPTFYDVRRLQRQGTNQAAAGSVQQQNSYTFNVADPASAEALGGTLDGIHNTQTRSAMRAAGMI